MNRIFLIQYALQQVFNNWNEINERQLGITKEEFKIQADNIVYSADGKHICEVCNQEVTQDEGGFNKEYNIWVHNECWDSFDSADDIGEWLIRKNKISAIFKALEKPDKSDKVDKYLEKHGKLPSKYLGMFRLYDLTKEADKRIFNYEISSVPDKQLDKILKFLK